MFDLSGKKALITGAAGGIGAAICEALAKQGADLLLCGSNQEKLQTFAKTLTTANPPECIAADLSDAAGVATVVSRIQEIGGVDILVCNAGITADTLAMRMKDEDWDRVITLNLTSTFQLIRGALKDMVKKRWGRVICISSVIASMGNPGQANYAASKAGMEGMARSMAMEVAPRGITINSLAPGFVQTPMTDKLNDEQKKRITANIPLQRLGNPKDIAGGVVFLASDEAAYITGQTLHVNGGLYMA